MGKGKSPVLTIFTTTKPFRGDIATIQQNAMQSWLRLNLRTRILVFGDAEGTKAQCQRLGIQQIPSIETNSSRTPLVSAMFAQAEEQSETALYCYVNADIMLVSDFAAAFRTVANMKRFLMVGRRWDVEVKGRWNFDVPDWEERLIDLTRREGIRHGSTGIDYFVYRRAFWGPIRPFAVGRSGWDNWLVYKARALRAPVVDASDVVTAVHQNHDYSHHAQGAAGVWEGEEAASNRQLVGGRKYAFSIDDATHRLTQGGIRLAFSGQNLKRRIATLSILRPRVGFVMAPLVHLVRGVRQWTMRREKVDS